MLQRATVLRVPQTHVTHRELRNDSGRILREVQAGATFVVTNNGQPVAVLKPFEESPLAGVRYQPRVPGARFCDVRPQPGTLDETALESLMQLRGDR